MSRGARWAPTFVPIDDPARWSWPLFRLAGVAWRMHAAMFVWLGVEVLRMVVGPLRGDPAAVSWRVIVVQVAALLVAVVVHETFRVVATRRSGPPPLSIAIWPLGGLGQVPPGAPARPRIAEAAGGLVGLGLLVAAGGLGLTLGAGGGWRLALGPLTGVIRPGDLPPGGGAELVVAQRVWVTVLLLHLLPMRPLDGGRLLTAGLSIRRGRRVADRIGAQVGLAVAGLALLAGVLLSAWLTVLAAVVGGAHALRRLGAIESGDDGEAEAGLGAGAALDLARAIGPTDRDGGGGDRAGRVHPLLDIDLDIEDADDSLGTEPDGVAESGEWDPDAEITESFDRAGRDAGQATAGATADRGPGAPDASDPDAGETPPAGPDAGPRGLSTPVESGAADPDALDRVLQRIGEVGLDGLNPAERAVLDRETARRRGEAD